tara:strand:- start:3563 stop:5650 length:2088 start_codon:yes stop_codon:yes gene_type:complete
MPIDKDPRAKATLELFRKWRDSRSDWDTEARNDIDFYLGNHFTESESDELQSRNQADVPMDRVSPAVEKLKSVLTARPPGFNVVPREDSDVQVSKLWNVILSYIWELSQGDAQMKQAIHDYATTGLGYLYVYVDQESDFGRGDVKFTHVDPFRVYVPPSTRNRWLDDAEGVILSTILTGDQLIDLYPGLGPQVDPETGEVLPGIIEDLDTYLEDDYPSSTMKNTVAAFTPDSASTRTSWSEDKYQILEMFDKVKVPFYRIVDVATGKESVLDSEGFNGFLQKNPGVFERGLMDFEEVFQTRIRAVASIGDYFLYENIMNCQYYPVIPMPNIWTGTPYPKSDVSRARPMQRLLNKLWSLALSHAQSSAGLKLIVPMGSAIHGIERLEQDWSNPNAVIEIDTSQGEPHYPAPQPLASEFYRLIQQCEFYIDFTFGLPEMMHGFPEKAPETVRGTERMLALGAERPKSKLRDLEFSLSRLGMIIYHMSKGHYSFQKIFRLAQPNNNVTEVMANYYDDVTGAALDIFKDKINLFQHDIKIEPGSTLPSSKWAELGVYMEAFKMGLVDDIEVLKKHPDIFDKEGIIQRKSLLAQAQKHIGQLEKQVQSLQGDLQTAQRESTQDRKRVAVEKFKGRLSKVEADAKATNKIQANKLANTVKLEMERLLPAAEDAIMESMAPYIAEGETPGGEELEEGTSPAP